VVGYFATLAIEVAIPIAYYAHRHVVGPDVLSVIAMNELVAIVASPTVVIATPTTDHLIIGYVVFTILYLILSEVFTAPTTFGGVLLCRIWHYLNLSFHADISAIDVMNAIAISSSAGVSANSIG
jgi:hypothetical protein